MKTIFFTSITLLLLNHTLALASLPNNAYLVQGDDLKAVKTLQTILNTNPDTIVTENGPGSPGNENWYFGELTKKALEKFQDIYGLEVTGRIDYKTWKKINDYVDQVNGISNGQPSTIYFSNKTTTINEKIRTKDQERININEQNKRDLEEAKRLKEEKSKSLLSTIVDKYTGFFNSSKNNSSSSDTSPNYSASSTQDIYSNSYSAQTPYLNPSTGIYSSNPASAQQPAQQPQMQTPYAQLFGSQSPYSSGANPYSNINAPGYYASQAPFTQSGPPVQGAEVSGGYTKGSVGKIGQCIATTFAHSTMSEGCRADGNDQQNNQKSASGLVMSRIGVRAIPAVAIWAGSFGDAIEVKDLTTGKCKAFPILERGPDNIRLGQGKCVDLTGSAYDILKGNQPCKDVTGPLLFRFTHSIPKVQYAIIPGEKIQPGQTKECTHLVKQN